MLNWAVNADERLWQSLIEFNPENFQAEVADYTASIRQAIENLSAVLDKLDENSSKLAQKVELEAAKTN
jgi:hypothetical protein